MERFQTTYNNNFTAKRINRNPYDNNPRSLQSMKRSLPQLTVKDLLTHSDYGNEKTKMFRPQPPPPVYQNQDPYKTMYPQMQQPNYNQARGNNLNKYTSDGDITRGSNNIARQKSRNRIGMKDILCHIDTNVKRIPSTHNRRNSPGARNRSGNVTMKDILYNSEPRVEKPRARSKGMAPSQGSYQMPTPTMNNRAQFSGSYQNGPGSTCSFCGKQNLPNKMNNQIPMGKDIYMSSNVPIRRP